MVHRRSGACQKDDIMGIVLAVEKYPQWLLFFRAVDEIVGYAEPKIRIEAAGFRDFRHKALHVIIAKRPRAAMEMRPVVQPRLGGHAGAEFNRDTGRITQLKCPSLEVRLGPAGLNSYPIEVGFGGVEVLVPEYTETDGFTHRRFFGCLQDEAVMTGFLDAAKINDIGILVRNQQPDYLSIKFTCPRQIAYREPDMTGTGDVERGRVVGLRYGHRLMHSAVEPMRGTANKLCCQNCR